MTIRDDFAPPVSKIPAIWLPAVIAVLLSPGGVAIAGGYSGSSSEGSKSPCAAYGPDYALVEGGTNCVRIGGHVRVQLGTNAAAVPGSAWTAGQTIGQAAPATLRSDSNRSDPMPTGSMPTHLRIQGGLGYPDPFH